MLFEKFPANGEGVWIKSLPLPPAGLRTPSRPIGAGQARQRGTGTTSPNCIALSF